jgi:hypothetical protein
MTAPAPRTHVYHHAVPGPELRDPFTVTHGYVIVTGIDPRMSVTIPRGGTWPGLDALPPVIAARLSATDSSVTPGTTWHPGASDEQIAAGCALATATLLRTLTNTDAFDLLAELNCPPEGLNQSTLGQLVGSTRETVAKIIKPWREARTDVSARVPHA